MAIGSFFGKSRNADNGASAKELDLATVTKIIVACPAGVGSSAVGAMMLRKKLTQEKLNIKVENIAIAKLTDDLDIIITQRQLTEQAQSQAPNAHHISLNNFLDNKLYSALVADLKSAQQ